MAKYYEQLQRVWHAYEKLHGYVPATARDAVKWGVGQGMIELQHVDPYDSMSEDMAKALREEYGIDSKGRRYRKNHAVRVNKAGTQFTMWAMIETAPREHMQKAFTQRREQIVGDCVQLHVDVEVYNGRHEDQPPIPMLLDFRDDVEERLNWNRGDDVA